MRCLHEKRFGSIFNSWADGKTRYNTESMSGLTFKAMQQAAANQKEISERVDILVHRTAEELYDIANDPGALHNLFTDPAYQERIERMRLTMLNWMEQTQDPLLPKFRTTIAAKTKANTEPSNGVLKN